MLNIPLAVRLVAFQFASENVTSPLQLSGSYDLNGCNMNGIVLQPGAIMYEDFSTL